MNGRHTSRFSRLVISLTLGTLIAFGVAATTSVASANTTWPTNTRQATSKQPQQWDLGLGFLGQLGLLLDILV